MMIQFYGDAGNPKLKVLHSEVQERAKMFPENPTIATKIIATVKIRRGEGWEPTENAAIVDGNRYKFQFAWHITEEDCSMYAGETAWMPYPTPLGDNTNYPRDGPVWIASGDLDTIHILKDKPEKKIPGQYTWHEKSRG